MSLNIKIMKIEFTRTIMYTMKINLTSHNIYCHRYSSKFAHMKKVYYVIALTISVLFSYVSVIAVLDLEI